MAVSRWSEKETGDFLNLLSKIERNIIGLEDIQDITLKMNSLGYSRDTEKYALKFGEMKRNHQNPEACKIINDIVAKEKAFKKSTRMPRFDSDSYPGPGDVNDQEADDITVIYPSTSSCCSDNSSHLPELHHFMAVGLEEGNGWQHPIYGDKKPRTETLMSRFFKQSPERTNSPGAPRTSKNLKRPSDQQLITSKAKNGMNLRELLEEKDWKGIKQFLKKCPSLSHQCLKNIAKLALNDNQMDVLNICSWRLSQNDSVDESHDQE
ncbi:uncharacterized protein [Procambarus clarkii]|uniref:uncharacterized protein isoform X1 n=1 Tax=Procambarus clarkii TaxID=6728 RepID=UPI0037433555